MAEIKEGILGGIKGKVSTVVGYKYRKKNVIRGLARKNNKPASEAQIKQRNKLTTAVKFLKGIKKFVNMHYPTIETEDKIKLGYDQLRSYLMTSCITYTDGKPRIAIDQLVLSIGTLPPAAIKKVSSLKDHRVKVQWDDSIINALTLPSDQLTMIIYNETSNSFYIIENIAKRADKYAHFELNNDWKNENIHCWSVWKSADQTRYSTSIYHHALFIDSKATEENTKVEQEAAE